LGVTFVRALAEAGADARTPHAGSPLPIDVWLRHSPNSGGTGSPRHLAGPFDMEQAPVAGA
jgi:hypothetical protein